MVALAQRFRMRMPREPRDRNAKARGPRIRIDDPHKQKCKRRSKIPHRTPIFDLGEATRCRFSARQLPTTTG